MKKLVCVFFILCILLFSIPLSVSAASGVIVEMVSEPPQSGDTVKLQITLNAGVDASAFRYVVEYDPEVLSFKGVSGGMYNEYVLGKVAYVNIIECPFDIADFTFVAKKAGNTSITVTEAAAGSTEEYNFPTVNYSFTVAKATKGDVNGDGNINTTDLAVLKLYLADSSVEISGYADLNDDSKINTTDLAMLKIKLAEG